jgi:deoxyhypusine synthase
VWVAGQAVLVKSETMPDDAPTVRGWDFSDGADLDGIMAAMLTSGFQATALGQAVNEVNRMVSSPLILALSYSRGCLNLPRVEE